MNKKDFDLRKLWFSLTKDQKRVFIKTAGISLAYMLSFVLRAQVIPRPGRCEDIARACAPHIKYGTVQGEDVCLWCYRAYTGAEPLRKRGEAS